MDIIEKNRNKIIAPCKKHKVVEFYLFGSIVTGKFNAGSDVDFLVEFGDVDFYYYFNNYMDLKEKLEKLLMRPVDLVENKTIKNPYLRKSIDRNKMLVYGRTDSQMALLYSNIS